MLQFYGQFEWLEAQRRLEFDFDAIAVLGLKIDLPKGGAEKIGASTGLGAENNVKRAESGKKAFFNVTTAGIEQPLCRSNSPCAGARPPGWRSGSARTPTSRRREAEAAGLLCGGATPRWKR